MKWIILPALIGVIFLASCQNDAPPGASPQSAADEDDIQPTALLEVEPEIVTENNSPPDEMETSTPPTPTEKPDGEMLTGSGTANANVLFVKAQSTDDSTWTFSVTVQHPDTGWEDYADGWDIVLPDGVVVKPDLESPFTRLLLHPHETEQPFTRSQGGIEIPPGIEQVIVRAHDLVDGFGGKEVIVDLTVENGPDFEVVR